MKRALLLLACAASLAGCGSGANDPGIPVAEDSGARWYKIPENREVLCIFKKVGYGAGLSCDWAGARERP